MAIRVALQHTTQYRYERPVKLSPQVIRLRPAVHSRTDVEAFSLTVEPKPHFVNWQQDPFGNFLARVVFPEAISEFSISVDLVASLVTINPFDFFLEPHAETYPFAYAPDQQRDLAAYLRATAEGGQFAQLAKSVSEAYATEGRRVVDVLVDINRHLQRSLRYEIRQEPGVFTPEQTLERGHGSCRDFAWLLVNLLRKLGIAARFVSGYSIQLVADQKPLQGPAGVDADCADLHAWAEAYLPGAGWVGLDATSGLFCGEGHIPLACTPEPSGAAPLSGSYEFDPRHEGDKVHCDFSFEMRVVRIEDRPRPTRSYTDEQWHAIVESGNVIDRLLDREDVRLTLGGEPTFVSVDEMESEEWNTAALGPSKQRLADQLIRKLRDRFAPEGLILHGQGKWYPGEQLPRWAYSLYFRKDGQPVWRNPALLSDGTDAGHDFETATQLMHHLMRQLGVPSERALPAYEDVFYYLWREKRLPCNVDPFDSRLEDEAERERLRCVFTQGLKSPVGLALPLRAQHSSDGTHTWLSGPWFLRGERLYLVPGDSAMGYRLPIDSLPWSAADDRVSEVEPDPFSHFPDLPREGVAVPFAVQVRGHSRGEVDAVPVIVQDRGHSRAVAQSRQAGTFASVQSSESLETPPVRGVSAGDVVRSALCIEPRAGVLYVFLPPIDRLEAYLDLVSKIETAARDLKLPIRLEGYPPPYHPQLERISVTPDPGVLEVNIHPAKSWSECVERTTALYADARELRLGTEKFMLDGRHTGTGGGNHVVLGGATPLDSPLLRRPDLLMSLVAFFNNHPALSYVFSGLFVGPTSQAPRIDEARNDSLYELEIARKTLAQLGTEAPLWLIDRVLRHLLVDATGNTHRAEFCIDKLYNPDSPQGRLGLLELRAFEMPPDARMSCAQQLLIRAMVAHFWRHPYQRRLVRWGTTLQDRFALPFFIWEDLLDALLELSEADVKLDPNWYLPHWEFRFPLHGQVAVSGGIRIELRQALEPWHVLGEEQSNLGTTRYVDSSVERLQVLVDGLTDSRHELAVAKKRIPLVATGRAGQFVAAVRYKAWSPPSSLHPTLKVNTPLVLDVYDTWNRRAIGGCTFHVAHPGGRAFDRFPSNALEAESRRTARFYPFGHLTGDFEIRATSDAPEFPLTLDLRDPR